MVTKSDIKEIIETFMDPNDPHYPGSSTRWFVDPISAVNNVAIQKRIPLTEDQVKIISILITRDDSFQGIEYTNKIFETENMIADAKKTIRPAFLSTLIINAITFSLGIMLVIASMYASSIGLNIGVLVFGGLGIIDIMLLLYRNPIKGLMKSIGNQIQLEVIFDSYTRQLRLWRPYKGHWDNEINQDIIVQIEDSTFYTTKLIQKYIKGEVVIEPKRVF